MLYRVSVLLVKCVIQTDRRVELLNNITWVLIKRWSMGEKSTMRGIAIPAKQVQTATHSLFFHSEG